MKRSAIVAICLCLVPYGANSIFRMSDVEIRFPRPGMLITQTFFPNFAITVDNTTTALQVFHDIARLCLTVVEDTSPTCVELHTASSIVIEDMTPGSAIMTVWIADQNGDVLSQLSTVRFEVASDKQMFASAADGPQYTAESLLSWYLAKVSPQKMQRSMLPFRRNVHENSGTEYVHSTKGNSALMWDDTSPLAFRCLNINEPLLLVVGVKSAVGNFDRRQAARKTWMRVDMGALKNRVCLRFITGRPGDELPIEAAVALRLEASIYGDILETSVGSPYGESGWDAAPDGIFDVVDSYENLLAKTVGFMAMAMNSFQHFQYMALLDDDVYVRLDRLTEALDKRTPEIDAGGFYAGQVWEDEFSHHVRPQRHPAHKNALSYDVWPTEVLPRFAAGPHYILSRYCVEFIIANQGWLRGVGTLEDVSIALWMLVLQVHPVHIDNFRDVKTGCADDALSLANVGPVGVHIAHSNLEQGRPLCHGFDPEEWHVSNGPHQRRPTRAYYYTDTTGRMSRWNDKLPALTRSSKRVSVHERGKPSNITTVVVILCVLAASVWLTDRLW